MAERRIADGRPVLVTAASEEGYDAWRTADACSKPIALDASVPTVNLNGYCDLDLFIMAPASEAYRGTNGIIWMQPRLTEFIESQSRSTERRARFRIPHRAQLRADSKRPFTLPGDAGYSPL